MARHPRFRYLARTTTSLSIAVPPAGNFALNSQALPSQHPLKDYANNSPYIRKHDRSASFTATISGTSTTAPTCATRARAKMERSALWSNWCSASVPRARPRLSAAVRKTEHSTILRWEKTTDQVHLHIKERVHRTRRLWRQAHHVFTLFALFLCGPRRYQPGWKSHPKSEFCHGKGRTYPFVRPIQYIYAMFKSYPLTHKFTLRIVCAQANGHP